MRSGPMSRNFTKYNFVSLSKLNILAGALNRMPDSDVVKLCVWSSQRSKYEILPKGSRIKVKRRILGATLGMCSPRYQHVVTRLLAYDHDGHGP